MSKTNECASDLNRARELLKDPDLLNGAARLMGELDPHEEETGHRKVRIPVGLIDGDWS